MTNQPLDKKIEFGVMSSRYSMECDDMESAKVAMCLFIGQNVPIAIYSPKESTFEPSNFLTKTGIGIPEEIRKALKSIRKLK